MRKLSKVASFKGFSTILMAIGFALVCGTAMGQEAQQGGDPDEFMLEEITVTAQFQATDLQKTPIAITAITGDTLEERNIASVADLGLVIPNSAIRQQSNVYGPNAYIGIRGVDQGEFIPAFEPGVVVYVDDIFNETIVGSTMDLNDLERVEVLRGPQGTLFGKNSIGGAIRLISKTPTGSNTGHIQGTYGEYNRLDFSGGYDFSMINDVLFARISGSSKRIDGYVNRLDFACQMAANGTPEQAGTFPWTTRHTDMSQGDCKIGEKGGSQSDAGKLVLRFLPTPKLEFNVGVDYTEIKADPGAETLIRGTNPVQDPFSTMAAVDNVFQERYGMSILGDQYVTGNPFSVYESFVDQLYDIRWPDKTDEHYTNLFAKVDYDITDDIHAKFIFGYREYQQVFATCNSTPLCINTTLNDMRHDQTSYELRLNGTLFDERLDWTLGGYYYKTSTDHTGYVTMGLMGIASDNDPFWNFVFGGMPYGFGLNDKFDNESKSAFIHGIYKITDKLSLTAGGRVTDEDKAYTFDHTTFFQIDEPLEYGSKHYDWKASVDYQFTDDLMVYYSMATGFRSEGAQPRPWNRSQLQSTQDEELLMYELGSKAQFFGNRLRVNAAAFYNVYDPRVVMGVGFQCTDPNGTDPGEVSWTGTCPPDSWVAQNGGQPTMWFAYTSAPGVSKGIELDIVARPIRNLDLNASVGWYNFKTDVGKNDVGYLHPDYDQQPDWTVSAGAQYRINFKNGSMLIPRLDMFYQGERTTGALDRKPISGNVVPDYSLYNARLTYTSSDSHWSLSLEAENLFDKLYWSSYPATKEYASDTSDEIVDSYGQFFGQWANPGRPRTVSLTLRYNFF